jgi:hypothetical protein
MPSNVVEVNAFTATVPRPLNTELADEASVLQFCQPLANRTLWCRNHFNGVNSFTAINCSGAITCLGDITADDATFEGLHVTADSVFDDDVEMLGDLDITGNLTMPTGSIVCGSLTVTASCIVSDNLTVSDDVSIGGTLAVNGNTTIGNAGGDIHSVNGTVNVLNGQLRVAAAGNLLVEGITTHEAPIVLTSDASVHWRVTTGADANTTYHVEQWDVIHVPAGGITAARVYTIGNNGAFQGARIKFVTLHSGAVISLVANAGALTLVDLQNTSAVGGVWRRMRSFLFHGGLWIEEDQTQVHGP